MRVYGYTITHEYGTDTLVHASPEGALHLCAQWCRSCWTATARAPEVDADEEMIERYKDAHPQEEITAFDAHLALDVNDLREAYCAAIDAGHTLDGDHDWINEGMAALSDALPSGWTVYSDDEVAEMTDLTGGDPLRVAVP